jgi:hypothetical protein
MDRGGIAPKNCYAKWRSELLADQPDLAWWTTKIFREFKTVDEPVSIAGPSESTAVDWACLLCPTKYGVNVLRTSTASLPSLLRSATGCPVEEVGLDLGVEYQVDSDLTKCVVCTP